MPPCPWVPMLLGCEPKSTQRRAGIKPFPTCPLITCWGWIGISYFTLQGTDTDADELNAAGVTTLIKQDGYRIWGSRTCDAETYIFESYTRTAQIVADTVAEAHFAYVDKPLTPSLVKDIVDGINKKLTSYVTAGKLLGARCWYDPEPIPRKPCAMVN